MCTRQHVLMRINPGLVAEIESGRLFFKMSDNTEKNKRLAKTANLYFQVARPGIEPGTS